jgi:excisionase family DNA binding protein
MDATRSRRLGMTDSRPGSPLASGEMALIDRDEAAELLGVHPRSLERYIEHKELGFPEPAKRVGRVRLWNRGDVTKWGKKMLPLPTGRPPKS